MRDSLPLTCSDIKEKTRLFFEDLLKEEERQAFLEHLQQCPSCHQHVRSLDSFTNQLWKLGEVNVPADFCSTVLFQLNKAEQRSGFLFKRIIVAGGLLAALVAAMVFGKGPVQRLWFKDTVKTGSSGPEGTETEQQAWDQTEENGKIVIQGSMEPSLSLVSEQEEAAARISVKEEPKIPEKAEATFPKEPSVVSGPVPDPGRPTAANPSLVHWHVLREDNVQEIELLRLNNKKRTKEIELERALKEKEKIDEEIGDLERKQNEVNQRMLSAPEAEQGMLSDERRDLERQLREQARLREEKEAVLQALRKEVRQNTLSLQTALEEKERRETEPMYTLGALGVQPDYQDEEFSLFTVTGKQLQEARTRLAVGPDAGSFLKEFSPAQEYLSDKKYRVSVYKEKDVSSARHWHITMALPEQKEMLLNVIREKGGTVTFQYKEEVIFSLPESEIEPLKEQMTAMRLRLAEFGHVPPPAKVIVSQQEEPFGGLGPGDQDNVETEEGGPEPAPPVLKIKDEEKTAVVSVYFLMNASR